MPMFFPREALEAIEYPPVVEQVRQDGRVQDSGLNAELASGLTVPMPFKLWVLSCSRAL